MLCVDESMNSTGKTQRYHYNDRNIAVKYKPVAKFHLRQPPMRKHSSVLDVTNEVNKRYNIDALPEETKRKLIEIYQVIFKSQTNRKGNGILRNQL